MNSTQSNLLFQLKTYREWLLTTVEDITEEEADIIPPAFNNNIRWNLGHIYLDQYNWIRALTKEPTGVPDAYEQWFGFGTSPANFQANTPGLPELKQLLSNQPEHLRKTYGNRLTEIFPPTEMGMETIEQVLIRTIYHEGMHLQAILDLKKCISSQSV
ncbi:DinB family protein [Alkalicoccobacillus gibsonii]|uniref:DinB family protein n=1 Tax=Alkalicoccobacillus gibsonii TaxID=79881 RepID=UPI0019349D4E|nr:DinB family protein [Alkalicoccobacillus gibsonii]MBM0066309.1 DinB family protein [Alkalicoccobacillus gibsonii]